LFSRLRKRRRINFQELYLRKLRENEEESLKYNINSTYLSKKEVRHHLELSNAHLLKKLMTLNYVNSLENNPIALSNPQRLDEMEVLKAELKKGIVETTYRIKYFSKRI